MACLTPILMCHGEGDPLVPVDGADMTYLLLQNQGCSRLKYIRYEGVGHEFRKVEGEDVRKFLSTYLGEGSLKLPMQGVLGRSSGDFGAMRRAHVTIAETCAARGGLRRTTSSLYCL